MLDDAPGSPDWWLMRLGRALRERQPQLAEWGDYYRGDPPLPTGPEGAVQAYKDFQRKSKTNFLAFVVGSSVHRLAAVGITDGAGRPLPEAWSWWQRNRLDPKQKQIYRTALSLSEAYAIVGPHPRDPRRPLITPEHPREVIVAHDAATGERTAALKSWFDDITGTAKATVYLPDVITRYEASRRGAPAWGTRSWAQTAQEDNPLGVVPVVPFQCRRDLGEAPEPDFVHGMDIQERINLGVLNRMTAERYSAFRQKYVTGHKFQPITDPETGLPMLDQNGQPKVHQPFKPHPGSLWASTGENVRFGEFSQTDLLGYLKTHQADVLDLLTVTHTPAYYYAGDLINVSSDAVVALDTNHVSKVREYQAGLGEAWEDVLSVAALVAGSDTDYSEAEIRWTDPRHLNPAVIADMGAKKTAMGYPLGVVAEDMGESPQRIKRIENGQARQAMLQAALSPSTQHPSENGPERGEGGATGRDRADHRAPGQHPPPA